MALLVSNHDVAGFSASKAFTIKRTTRLDASSSTTSDSGLILPEGMIDRHAHDFLTADEVWNGDFPLGIPELVVQKEGFDLPRSDDATYWQTSARWMMLQKYRPRLLPRHLQNPYHFSPSSDGHLGLVFSDYDTQLINQIWQGIVNSVVKSSDDTTDAAGNKLDDLSDFLKNGGSSNGFPLQWSFRLCGPNARLKLHAHKGLELVYCLRGALHEVRLQGEPVASEQDFIDTVSMSFANRKWKFQTLQQGQWMINEIGSVHQSFTASSGTGCCLLVLSAGSHWNVPESDDGRNPTVMIGHENIQDIIERLNDKLCAGNRKSSKDWVQNWYGMNEIISDKTDNHDYGVDGFRLGAFRP